MDILTGKITIREIFKDHWEPVLAKHKAEIPDHVVDTVNKMLVCRDPQRLGYAKYSCPEHPQKVRIVPHSCKSRFCNSCGVLQTNKWMNKALGLLPNATYYHITFTVPDYLWYFFKERINMLDYLFKASSETVLGWFRERKIIPALCSGLHSFGKDLKFNSHIHMILSAGGLLYSKGKYKWKSIKFMPYKKMVKVRFRAILLGYLKPYLDYELKELLYSLNWYVHVNMKVLDVTFTSRYIGRYAKKPALAEARITDYDGSFVTFFYKERSKPAVFSKLTAEEFILKLIQHILPPQFRAIRYYGLLANRVSKKFKRIISKLLRYIQEVPPFPHWRQRQIKFKGLDPLRCPVCGKEMLLREIAYLSKASGELAYRSF